ncbi:uncharacterized protein LOC132194747 isoform X2 [Neocloeon triangulifer]|uniref:uncharacterized protein LOC132194747 isoform X2 n=1 Tax=Neocloeon triangulifer TaxID=2078957 RepID=UPI00286EBB7E|nr:uncharacterized protein LOC132194747 isoform X2 [Neocloeon triangulifer]
MADEDTGIRVAVRIKMKKEVQRLELELEMKQSSDGSEESVNDNMARKNQLLQAEIELLKAKVNAQQQTIDSLTAKTEFTPEMQKKEHAKVFKDSQNQLRLLRSDFFELKKTKVSNARKAESAPLLFLDDDEEEDRQIPELVLKPFAAKPRLEFLGVLVGSTKCQSFLITNPDSSDLRVEITVPDKIQVESSHFNVPAKSSIEVNLTWGPQEKGTFFESIHVKDSKGRRGMVSLVLEALVPMPKKDLKNSASMRPSVNAPPARQSSFPSDDAPREVLKPVASARQTQSWNKYDTGMEIEPSCNTSRRSSAFKQLSAETIPKPKDLFQLTMHQEVPESHLSSATCIAEQRKSDSSDDTYIADRRVSSETDLAESGFSTDTHAEGKLDSVEEASGNLTMLENTVCYTAHNTELQKLNEVHEQFAYLASVTIQTAWRCYCARQTLARLVQEDVQRKTQAASLVQKRWRGKVVRRHVQQMKRELEIKRIKAATVIQCSWKCYAARQALLRLRKEHFDGRRRTAATKIQCFWRRVSAQRALDLLKVPVPTVVSMKPGPKQGPLPAVTNPLPNSPSDSVQPGPSQSRMTGSEEGDDTANSRVKTLVNLLQRNNYTIEDIEGNTAHGRLAPGSPLVVASHYMHLKKKAAQYMWDRGGGRFEFLKNVSCVKCNAKFDSLEYFKCKSCNKYIHRNLNCGFLNDNIWSCQLCLK